MHNTQARERSSTQNAYTRTNANAQRGQQQQQQQRCSTQTSAKMNRTGGSVFCLIDFEVCANSRSRIAASGPIRSQVSDLEPVQRVKRTKNTLTTLKCMRPRATGGCRERYVYVCSAKCLCVDARARACFGSLAAWGLANGKGFVSGCSLYRNSILDYVYLDRLQHVYRGERKAQAAYPYTKSQPTIHTQPTKSAHPHDINSELATMREMRICIRFLVCWCWLVCQAQLFCGHGMRAH